LRRDHSVVPTGYGYWDGMSSVLGNKLLKLLR
jgi:hypothetical protein